jgi:RNA polymerase sigma-54 factor
MRLDITPQLRLDLRMRLAPQMIQSMEILQLPLLALEERIEQEMTENPVLEMQPPEAEAPRTDEPLPTHPEADLPARSTEDFRSLDRLPDDWERYLDDPLNSNRQPRHYSQERDRKLEAMQNTAAPGVSIQEHLEQQLSLEEVDADTLALAREIIWNLDDKGYLRFSLEEILAGQDGQASLDRAQAALALVQSLDPPGVGARDLRECLRLQLDRRGEPPGSLLRAIVERHLADLSENRLPLIARSTGASIEAVKSAAEAVARLNPSPGASYVNEAVAYVVPDVIVEATDFGYEVHLEDNWTPRLFISRGYRDLARRRDVDQRTREFITSKIRSAKWLIDSIEQRRTTVLAVARSIVKFQQGFLEHGVSHLKPLKMQTVADDVGVHVSTVSRAISGKYMQTPRGIFPMKFFFTGGTTTDAGAVASWRTIKQHIQELIANEDKANPKSDEEIAAELQKAGFDVARRTVTKYRKTEKIPSSRQRRVF